MTVALIERLGWTPVIAHDELPVEMGIPALVDGDAVAVFRTWDGVIHAVSNLDPRTGASVMARGIVGSRGTTPTVASPLYKDVFDLRTGICLDDPSKRLRTYQVRVVDGMVEVRGSDDGDR